MKRFADLFAALDRTTRTNDKLAAMEQYFREAPPRDAAWAAFLLSGRKVRQILPTRRMVAWAIEAAGTTEWLFNECYDVVGDLAETMALILPESSNESIDSLADWMERLLPLRTADEETQRSALLTAWSELSTLQRFLVHKLITGGFRVGVSERLVHRAIAQAAGLPVEIIAHRLTGDWQPSGEFFSGVMHPDTRESAISQPYPFLLAHPLEMPLEQLGDAPKWQAEWKWDGIRAQLIRRGGEVFLWSRGEELVTERFPEIAEAARGGLPDGVVLDGEILAWRGDRPLPFADLQKRIGRKNVSRRVLERSPVVFVAFDLLEHEGADIRDRWLEERRGRLSELLVDNDPGARLRLSKRMVVDDWNELRALREESRDRGTEGLMLKRLDSPYGVGRPRGDWWKWKIDPYTVDAVLIYAQRGNGKRASLYTDYTFGVWDQGELVPFAKAYSGLTDAEIREVDAFVRANTLERFGPVRTVTPALVFELAFENIQLSTRHRSGIAVRFPRIARWRQDKLAKDVDTLETLRSLAAITASQSSAVETNREEAPLAEDWEAVDAAVRSNRKNKLQSDASKRRPARGRSKYGAGQQTLFDVSPQEPESNDAD